MRDQVTPELRALVLARDGGCVATRLDADHQCMSLWGPVARTDLWAMTLDHVKDEPRMGRRAPSDAEHLVTLCYGAHIVTGWATSHRPELRDYLARVTA